MDLPKSRLGTKEYWDKFYEREIENFKNNKNDTGECWFDDCGAEQQVCRYLEEEGVSPNETIVDLGTGNGHLLFALKEEGVDGKMLGVDYSEASVEFAKRVAEHENYDVEFEVCDFINNPNWTSQKFDIILDKGTLDAIALSTIPDAVLKYKRSVLELMKPTSKLIITSCNFTEEELANLIGLQYDKLKYPEFTFGGVKGSPVVTLIFTN